MIAADTKIKNRKVTGAIDRRSVIGWKKLRKGPLEWTLDRNQEKKIVGAECQSCEDGIMSMHEGELQKKTIGVEK